MPIGSMSGANSLAEWRWNQFLVCAFENREGAPNLLPVTHILNQDGDPIMSIVKNTEADFAALRDDLALLKGDIATLMSTMQASAVSGAQNAAAQAEKQAKGLYNSASAEGEKAAKMISDKVEEQPVTAILIALGIGYVTGRLTAR